MSGPWHPTGRARVSARRPEAIACCDRCGFTFQLSTLRNQAQWQGFTLQPQNVFVCGECLDVPQIQLKTIILPPDPMPVLNPRPEMYVVEVPSYLSTEGGDHFVTEDGDHLVTMIRVTPNPDPNDPYTYVEA